MKNNRWRLSWHRKGDGWRRPLSAIDRKLFGFPVSGPDYPYEPEWLFQENGWADQQQQSRIRIQRILLPQPLPHPQPSLLPPPQILKPPHPQFMPPPKPPLPHRQNKMMIQRKLPHPQSLEGALLHPQEVAVKSLIKASKCLFMVYTMWQGLPCFWKS